MKFLVVDDDPISRKVVEKIVSGLGNYDSVGTGGAALDAFDEAWKMGLPFDVIFLDISMPDMSGIDVLKTIRHFENEKKLMKDLKAKILMMTASSDKETVIACLESGCNNYIVKPVNKTTVAGKLKHLGYEVDV